MTRYRLDSPDWAQLSSIETGGAFGLLVRDRGADAPELDGVRRLTQAWERDASARHDRIAEGQNETMVETGCRPGSATRS